MRPYFFAAAFAAAIAFAGPAAAAGSKADFLDPHLANTARSEKFVARDSVRKPKEVLGFFGLKPNMTIVEIWPGGGYWTEFLAPAMTAKGTYYLALPPAGRFAETDKYLAEFKAKLAADPARYGKVKLVDFGRTTPTLLPDNSVDMIVTFRNLHNWMAAGYEAQALQAFYKALKPGGILGVEDHRGQTDKAQDPKSPDGYVRQWYAIELIEKAGFKFAGSSELLANYKDTANWEKGVWTLPPTYALGDVDKEKYKAIGEGDNFLLKFVKPAK